MPRQGTRNGALLVQHQFQDQEAAEQEGETQQPECHPCPGLFLSLSHSVVLLSGRSMPDASYGSECHTEQCASPALLLPPLQAQHGSYAVPTGLASVRPVPMLRGEG